MRLFLPTVDLLGLSGDTRRYANCPPNVRFKLCGRGPRAEADAARRLRAGACPAKRAAPKATRN